MKRLRLVKVIIQPVFVVDDGGALQEVEGQQQVITDVALDGFPAKFRADMAEAERNLNADQAGIPAPVPATNGIAPNRATRRAKTPS